MTTRNESRQDAPPTPPAQARPAAITPETALSMAKRIARRMTIDTPYTWAEDYVNFAALAILRQAERNDDAALLWAVGRRAVIDQHRSHYGRSRARARWGNDEYREDWHADTARFDDDVIAVESAAAIKEAFDERPRPPLPLTRRQHQILRLLAAGYTPRDCWERLGMNKHTYRSCVQSMRRLIGAATNEQMIALAIQRGELEVGRVAA